MSVRMLSRPPSSSTSTPSASSASAGVPTRSSLRSSSPTFSSSSGAPPESGGGVGANSGEGSGVVVVGAVGRTEDDVAQLLDRILDAKVFTVKGKGRDWWQKKTHDKVVSGKNLEKRSFNGAGGNEVHSFQEVQHEDVRAHEEESSANFSVGEGGEKLRRRESSRGSASGGKLQIDESEANIFVQGDVTAGVNQDGDCRKVASLQSKLKHYYDEEKGVVYLQFSWGSLPLDSINSEDLMQESSVNRLSASLDHNEAEALRGLLFMFSVCHVVLLVQEGARFDPGYLHTFRILQTAKHSLAPYVKSQVLPGLLPSASSRSSPLRPVSLASGNSSGRNGASGRHTSIIALMSGSAPVLFPGQCIPVILFVFLEDAAEGAGNPRSEEVTESGNGSAHAQVSQSNISNLSKHASQPKVSTSSAVRPGGKSEAGLRRKMQTAIEAQIRFLLKKCRPVATAGDPGPLGSGVGSGMGPRGPGSGVSSLPGGGGGGALFVLDPSRAVVLVDRSSNRICEALDAATEAIEDVLDGKIDIDQALWELAARSGTVGDEILIIKGFLSRQAEILRGRGGISNNSAGGSAGVGMVAAAAAAAAASAAAGSTAGSGGGSKPLCNPPELPSMATWLAACRLIAEALSTCGTELKEGSGEKIPSPKILEGSRGILKKGSPGIILSGRGVLGLVQNKGTVEAAIASLEGGSDLDFKFSATWCKRLLPSAKEVYLKGLPPCYPTSVHKAQLGKAMRAFCVMVRGPAVSRYVGKLIQECETVWHSGRQLCDAESLTGKPCTHQVHEVQRAATNVKAKETRGGEVKAVPEVKSSSGSVAGKVKQPPRPHSSGVVFLHACACGRSRKLREDPFDYHSANVTFFQFPNCENMLPSLVLPDSEASKPLGGEAWSLVRLGNEDYYQAAIGLQQSGFCSRRNFLTIWDLPILYRQSATGGRPLPGETLPVPKTLSVSGSGESKKSSDSGPQVDVVEPQLAGNDENKLNPKALGSAKGSPEEPRMGFLRAVSSVPEVRKAPTAVATRLNFFGDPAFPPLPQKNERQAMTKYGKLSGRDRKESVAIVSGESRISDSIPIHSVESGEKKTKLLERPALHTKEQEVQMAPNVNAPVSVESVPHGTMKSEHVRIYIGFEHECPYGHRFLLSVEDLDRLGPPFSQKSAQSAFNVKEEPESPAGLAKQNKLERKAASAKAQPVGRRNSVVRAELTGQYSSTIGSNNISEKAFNSSADGENSIVREASGGGHVLLNSNLPIFMNCPYCDVEEHAKQKTDGLTFAGTTSQLQRIFLMTPSLPLLLASCPVVEFELQESDGQSAQHPKASAKFNVGCEVVLPPDSLLSLRLPFVYFSESDDGSQKPLVPRKDKPEHTAWLVKGTALYVLSTAGGDAAGS